MSEPEPQSNPTLTSAQLAVREGNTSAIEEWAAEVEAAGNPAAAGLIRDLPGLRDNIAGHLTELRESWPDVGVTLHYQDERSYWFLGDSEMAESTDDLPNRWPHMMGQLLIHWNLYYPGVEWLARQLQLPRVQVESGPYAELREGQHLAPIPPGDEVGYLVLEPAAAPSAKADPLPDPSVPTPPPKPGVPGKCLACGGLKSVGCEACGCKGYQMASGEEQECVRCDCMGFHTCPVCNGSGKLKPKPSAKPKTKAKKAAPKGKPPATPKATAKTNAKPKPAAKAKAVAEVKSTARKKPKK